MQVKHPNRAHTRTHSLSSNFLTWEALLLFNLELDQQRALKRSCYPLLSPVTNQRVQQPCPVSSYTDSYKKNAASLNFEPCPTDPAWRSPAGSQVSIIEAAKLQLRSSIQKAEIQSLQLFQTESRNQPGCLWNAALSSSVFPQSLPHPQLSKVILAVVLTFCQISEICFVQILW